jgi:hypothetical protein
MIIHQQLTEEPLEFYKEISAQQETHNFGYFGGGWKSSSTVER